MTGVAVSVDSLDARLPRPLPPRRRSARGHDRRRSSGCAQHRLDFIIQTTVTRGNRDELARLVAWAAEQGAVSFNCYFLVPTGRGARLTRSHAGRVRGGAGGAGRRISASYRGPDDGALPSARRISCGTCIERDPDRRCSTTRPAVPCGTQYCRITPDGKLTPCPYLPAVGGRPARRSRSREIWRESPLFRQLRAGALGGKCGRCEYRAAVRRLPRPRVRGRAATCWRPIRPAPTSRPARSR